MIQTEKKISIGSNSSKIQQEVFKRTQEFFLKTEEATDPGVVRERELRFREISLAVQTGTIDIMEGVNLVWPLPPEEEELFGKTNREY